MPITSHLDTQRESTAYQLFEHICTHRRETNRKLFLNHTNANLVYSAPHTNHYHRT